MAGPTALKYLWTSLVQGGNDAFVQAQIATGLFGQTKTAYRVREIITEWSGTLGAGNAAQYEFALTRKSFAAMPVLTDKSLIVKTKRIGSFTTSGQAVIPQIERIIYSDLDNLLIVEDPVYAQLDSNASGATNTLLVRIGYEIVTLSDVDRLTLIAQSLA